MFGGGNESSQLSINRPTTDALLNLINGFLLTVTCRGNIVVISPSIEQHLGHCQVSGRNGGSKMRCTHSDWISASSPRLLSCSIISGGERAHARLFVAFSLHFYNLIAWNGKVSRFCDNANHSAPISLNIYLHQHFRPSRGWRKKEKWIESNARKWCRVFNLCLVCLFFSNHSCGLFGLSSAYQSTMISLSHVNKIE